ncbi:MAG: type II toxin-antitoxin system HicA family toxin [Sideroxydans sp.]|nr:type II toxin-antitoxin system HicA family toxin [Sideroxydans sp.]
MSKEQKRKDRLTKTPPPKDFRWEELVSVMNDFGFEFDSSSGGSHGHFVLKSDKDKTISSYRPHPSGIMYSIQLKEIVKKLKEWGML